ncbi:hypothetical protein NHX12_026513 [Muraenolepis orangiensis]|uniref:t-SNARE coiled-coil homology domain-containing protein n=1 Tax=Muraenolepis orangiensis TaxID=630683 RepID=A0A9Q0EIR8_9TELE|nr:hypothetical protein NHX12_026513 [Muraenolepis orangiensis]
MRDRLQMLQSIREDEEWGSGSELDLPETSSCSEGDLDFPGTSQEAVVFRRSDDLDGVLREALSMRKEISLLSLEVDRLARHNQRFGTSMRRLTLLKRDSDSIARGIHRRGEALYGRLQALGERRRRLEEEEAAPGSALSRIAGIQHGTLTQDFHRVMDAYNRAEDLQRKTCRGRIQRQASILGANISDQRLDTMVDKGGEGWAELSQSLQTEGGRTCRLALCEIKGRHKELVDLEARMKEVHELFLHMAMLVEEQGFMVNNIEENVRCTQEYIEQVNVEIVMAVKWKRKNPLMQCCPCLPCWGPVT